MANTNNIVIKGNIAADATVRTNAVSVNVAVNGVRHQDGTQNPTVYYNVTQRYSDEEKATAAAEKLKKGTGVLVSGKLNRRAYTRKDGTMGYSNDVYQARIETATGLAPNAELTLHGRLTKDPERFGKTVVLTMPVQGPYDKDKDRNNQPVFWMNGITFFNETADNVEKNLHKGDFVTVTGRLDERSFTKKDGSKGTNLTLSCNSYPADVHRANAGGAAATEEAAVDDVADFAPLEDDDAQLPF